MAQSAALLRAMRPKQWLKNLLVFAAPLAAGDIFQLAILTKTFGAFVAFCLVASSAYLINDLRDIEADRAHPKKHTRPLASGALKSRTAVIAAILLMLFGLALAFAISMALGGVVVAYVIATLAYSLHLKNEPVIELALLALGFLLRSIAGAAATGLPVSQWFLIVAGFGSLFMAAGKRYSELERTSVEGTDLTFRRKSLQGYTAGYLRFVWGMAAAVTVTGYCLWAFEVAQKQSTLPWAQWSVLPFVLAIMRYAVVIDRSKAEAPEDALLQDRVLLVLGVAWLVLFGLGSLGV